MDIDAHSAVGASDIRCCILGLDDGILSPLFFRVFKGGAGLISDAVNRLVLFHQINFLEFTIDSLHFTSQFGGFVGDVSMESILQAGNY